jgi:hypothetical protein
MDDAMVIGGSSGQRTRRATTPRPSSSGPRGVADPTTLGQFEWHAALQFTF